MTEKMSITVKLYRQKFREAVDGHVWLGHPFLGKRSARGNIWCCCTIMQWNLYIFLFLQIKETQKDKKALVVLQLERIFPSKWTWELLEQDSNKFVTRFWSRIELQRAIAFGGADVRDIRGNNPGLRLQFEEWQEREEGFLLP